jgi:assimilatory nitrate reductase catalytic subunit
LPGDVKPDWWALAEVGRRMGWTEAFAFDCAADVYREHARLSHYQNEGRRLFDIGHHAIIGNHAYDEMEPYRWSGTPFVNGRFSTDDGRARLVSVKQAVLPAPLADWPLTLNTGRYRDQWHTMTRTGLSPRLARHRQEPFVEIHPKDAERLGIGEGDLVRVATAQGESVFPALLSDGQRPGELFTPIHWTDQQSTGGRTGLLPRPLVDPHSGQPGFKLTPARAEKLAVEWRGFLVAEDLPDAIDVAYATRVRLPRGWLVELAGNGDMAAFARKLLPQGDRIETSDAARGQLRIAILEQGSLKAALYLSRSGGLPSREWLIEQLQAPEQPSSLELLAGRPAQARPDRGPIVCVCFDVGLNSILSAISEQRLVSVEEVGVALQAGTNCGSCRPALARLINQSAAVAAAE